MAKRTVDAVDQLYRHYYRDDPERRADLQVARSNAEIARTVYALRTQAGLTQAELARRVGTTASVICRLEDDDYEGHSLSMLRRIADALDQDLHVRFVPKAPDIVGSPR